jgi:CDP-diacylglycerol--serine O-phosphatidyltransferase
MVFCSIIESFRSAGFRVDSLADMVTSGVVPGYVMFLCFQIVSMKSQRTSCCRILDFITMGSCYVWLYSTSIPVRRIHSLVYRPANALFILSLPLVLKYSDSLIVLEI